MKKQINAQFIKANSGLLKIATDYKSILSTNKLQQWEGNKCINKFNNKLVQFARKVNMLMASSAYDSVLEKYRNDLRTKGYELRKDCHTKGHVSSGLTDARIASNFNTLNRTKPPVNNSLV